MVPNKTVIAGIFCPLLNQDCRHIWSPSKLRLQAYLVPIVRLNSGIKNRLNFLAWAIYIFQQVVSDSVNHADSEDIKILIQFPGKSIFENFAQFLKKRGRHQYAWVFDSQNHSGCSTFYADQFHI